MLVCKKTSGQYFAMKILNKETIEKRNQQFHTKSERNIMAKMDMPFIVKLQHAFQTPEKLYFVMEFVPGGELFYHLRRAKRFSEERTVFYAAEIVLALEFLHRRDIIYRDLKPENVLLDKDGHIKLTDLGLSKEGVILNKEKTYTFCGTPEYLAPEIIKGDGHGKEVDWWSLGILIYEMLNGRAPFVSKNRQEVLKSILQKRIEMKSFFSAEAKRLLRKLLCVDPQKRLGSSSRDAEEIKAEPFFKSINWAELEQKRVKPVFNPEVAADDDCKNIDPMFLKEEPVDTPTDDLGAAKKKGANYDGFTYNRSEFSLKMSGEAI